MMSWNYNSLASKYSKTHIKNSHTVKSVKLFVVVAIHNNKKVKKKGRVYYITQTVSHTYGVEIKKKQRLAVMIKPAKHIF